MRKHFLMMLAYLIGSIIGTFIFGNAQGYIHTFIGATLGYWTCVLYWRKGKSEPTNISNN
jgi:uncharacterized membrane protein YdjX (TVP38/TMEM64 family)